MQSRQPTKSEMRILTMMRGILREIIQDECGRAEDPGIMRIKECVDDTTTHSPVMKKKECVSNWPLLSHL